MIFAQGLFMRFYNFLLILILFVTGKAFASSSRDNMIKDIIVFDEQLVNELCESGMSELRPNPLKQFLRQQQQKNKKLTCAILAFPFPFGIVGLHRIYMGTAPYVPVVYIASLGGVFGILPMIDFIVILCKKNPEQYFGNGKVFMWVD